MELFIHNPLQNHSLPLYLDESPKGSRPCNMLKILFVESGKCNIKLSGTTASVSPPCILCLHQEEHYKIYGSAGLNARLLYFSPALVNSSFTLTNISGDIRHLPESAILDHYLFKPFLRMEGQTVEWIKLDALSADRMLTLFNTLKARMNQYQDHYWPCHNRSGFIELLIMVQYCAEQQHGALPCNKDAITDVLHYLHLHYAEKISIEALCRHFGTNRNTLNKRFRSTTGQSVIDYLVKLRIDTALRLLRETMLPVAEIAERVGFSDLSYWGRVFKKATGQTPLTYRKAIR